MQVTLNVDIKSKDLQKTINDEANRICRQAIYTEFFDGSQFTPQGNSNKLIKDAVDELIKKEFNGDNIKIFFEKNWDKIFAEAMERALRHKANAIAFNQVKQYIPKTK